MEVLQKGSPANRVVAAILAVVLAIGLMPLPAYATTATGGETPAANNAAATGGESVENGTAPTGNGAAAGGEDPVGTLTERPAAESGTSQPEDGSGATTPAADPDPAQQQRDEAFTAGWESGAWVISEPGAYKLTRDIVTEGMLTIAAPAGETVTLDFDGHAATVAGVVYAGIDVGPSLGAVVIKDGAYERAAAEAKAAGREAPAPEVRLAVEGYGASTALVGIQARYAALPDAQKADAGRPALTVSGIGVDVQLRTLAADAPADMRFDAYGVYVGFAGEGDVREAVDATLANVVVSAAVQRNELAGDAATRAAELGDKVLGAANVGTAYGVYAAAPAVSLGGRLEADVQSEYASCALYADDEGAFSLASDLAPRGTLSVYAAGNAENAVFARYDAGLAADEALLAHFEDATGNGLLLVARDGALAFASQPEADGTDAVMATLAGVASGDEPGEAALMLQLNVMSVVSGLFAQEAGPVDLARNGGPFFDDNGNLKTDNVAINAAGEYYLSKSIEGFTKNVTITGQTAGDITIDLHGHHIETSGTVTLTAGTIAVSKAVTIVGGTVADGEPAEESKTPGFYFTGVGGAMQMTNALGSATLKDMNISASYQGTNGNGSALQINNMRKVANSSKTVTLENCTIVNDLSSKVPDLTNLRQTNQSQCNIYGLYVAGTGNYYALESLVLKNTTVRAIVPVCTNRSSLQSGQVEADRVTTFDGTAAFISGNTGTTVDGCTFEAAAGKGAAVALRASANTGYQLVLQGGQTTLKANAGTGGDTAYASHAWGLIGSSNVALSTAPKFELDSTASYALAANVVQSSVTSAPFILNKGVEFDESANIAVAEGLAHTLVGTQTYDLGSRVTGLLPDANPAEAYVFRFADDYDGPLKSGSKETLAKYFKNATDDEATHLVGTAAGVKFTVSQDDAAASIDRGGDTLYFPSLLQASNTAQAGDTVKLLQAQSSEAEFKGGAKNQVRTLDLNGHSLEKGLKVSAAGTVNITDTASDSEAVIGPGEFRYSTSTVKAALYISQNATTVALSNVKVVVADATSEAYGLFTGNYNNATFTLNNGASVSVSSKESTNLDFAVYGGYGGVLNMNEGATIAVTQSSSGASSSAYGYKAQQFNISGGSMRVTGGAKAYGVYKNDASTEPMSMTGGLIRVEGGASATTAHAIHAVGGYNDRTTLTIGGGELEVACSASATDDDKNALDAVDVFTGIYNNQSPTIMLKGSPTFKLPESNAAATHIVQAKAMNVDVSDGSGFSLATNGSLLVGASGGLTDDIFAKPTGATGMTLESRKGLFASSSSERYEQYKGLVSFVDQGGELAWVPADGLPVKIVDADGNDVNVCRSVAAGIKLVQDGQKVVLVQDVASTALTVGKDATVDLAGHALSIAQTGSASGAVNVTAGTLTVVDTGESKGGVALALKASKASDTPRGIWVKDSGALVLDGASVSVSYGGGCSVPAVYGAYVSSTGSGEGPKLALKNGACLSVSAGDADDAAADSVYGIYDWSVQDRPAAISVEGGSTVNAENGSPLRPEGSIKGRDFSTNEFTTTGLSDATVREFRASENAALYVQIVKKFQIVAKYDENAGSSSGTGNVYGARIYWAAPMQLDDGTYVWAFSKPVQGDDVGDASKIVPEKIYLQSTYQVAPSAVGIGAEVFSGAAVNVAGGVHAACAHGDAYALRPNGTSKASWNVQDGAALAAHATGEDAYLRNTGSAPDLRTALGLGSSVIMNGGSAFYPSDQSQVTEVVEQLPIAAGVAEAPKSEAAVTLSGTAAYDVEAALDAEILADKVLLDATFAGAIGSIRIADRAFSTAEGVAFASAAGEGGSVTSAQRAVFVDATGAYDPVPKDDGSVEWGAAYTVEFKDYYGSTVAKLGGVRAGDEIVMPDFTGTGKPGTTTKTYPFAGWSADPSAAAGDAGVHAAGAATAFEVPDASAGTAEGGTGTVAYYAVFGSQAKPVTVTFKYYEDGISTKQVTKSFDAGVGETLVQAGISPMRDIPHPEDGSYDDSRNRHHERFFIGWEAQVPQGAASADSLLPTLTTRVIDADYIGSYVPWTADNEVVLEAHYIDCNTTDYYRAIAFKVDGYVYSCGSKVGNKGVRVAFSTAYKASPTSLKSATDAQLAKHEVAGETWTFLGWVKGRHNYDESTYPTAVDYTANADASTALPKIVQDRTKGTTYTLYFDDSTADETLPDNQVIWYTASFKKTGDDLRDVSLYYYSNWDKSNPGKYSVNLTASTYGNGKFQVPYGTQLVQIGQYNCPEQLKGVNLIGYVSTGDKGWRAHEFLGWSTRKGDKQPLEAVPSVGSGFNSFYAVYSDVPMQTDVTLVWDDADGKEQRATITANANDTLESLLASAAYQALDVYVPEGKLLGWTDDEAQPGSLAGTAEPAEFASADNPEPMSGEGRTKAAATLWAVYKSDAQLTLNGNADNWAKGSYTFDAVKDAVFSGDVTTPYRKGAAFVGWNRSEDGAGDDFDLAKDAVDDDNLELWAQYKDITAKEGEDGSAVDASNAYDNTSNVADAQSITVSVEKAARADASLQAGLGQLRRAEALAYYAFEMVADRGDVEVDLTPEFGGTVSVTVPVPAGYEDKDLYIYALQPDGKVGEHAATVSGSAASQAAGAMTTQAEGGATATASIPATASSNDGNLVLAWKKTDADVALEDAKAQLYGQLETAFKGYSSADYTADNWQAMEDALNDGEAAVMSAGNVDEAKEAAQQAVYAMAGVPTMRGLATAKAVSLQSLAEAYAALDKSAYTEENWAKVIEAYEDAKDAVNASASANEAYTAASAGIIAMGEVETGTGASDAGSSGSQTGGLSGGSSGGTTASRSSGLTNTAGSSSSSGLSATATGIGGGLSYDAGSLMGASLQNLTADLATQKGTYMEDWGVYVDSVDPNGSAAKAGIQAGDVIFSADGSEVKDLAALQRALAGKKAGDEVKIEVNRNGESHTYTVTLTEDDVKAIEEAGKAVEAAAAAAALGTGNGTDSFGGGDEAASGGQGGFAQWVSDNLPLFIALCIVVLAAIAGLAWWLLRRRNRAAGDEDDDFWADDMQGAAAGA